jgi:hypothetical protein
MLHQESAGTHQKRADTRSALAPEMLAPEVLWDRKRAGTGKGLAPEKLWHQKMLTQKGWHRKCSSTRKMLTLEVLWHQKNAD